MKKEAKKVFIIITIVLFLLIVFSNLIFAKDTLISNVDNYNITSEDTEIPLAGKILGIVRLVGTIVSVIALAIIGIKYMIGSVEEKAEYKKTMIPYIIGAVLLFGGTNLVQMVYDTTKNIGASSQETTYSYYFSRSYDVGSYYRCDHCGAHVSQFNFNQGFCPICKATFTTRSDVYTYINGSWMHVD